MSYYVQIFNPVDNNALSKNFSIDIEPLTGFLKHATFFFYVLLSRLRTAATFGIWGCVLICLKLNLRARYMAGNRFVFLSRAGRVYTA
jgi:hypothetical protein